jgi:cobalt-zinc-cadmium resistance protein CzcA
VQKCATLVIGGLISATLLTLLVLPALDVRFGERKRPERKKRSEPVYAAPVAAE